MNTEIKSHQDIDGWFNHEAAYDYLIEQMPEGGTFVELGAWLGKSSAYLCDKATGKQITIIDTWKGSPNELTTTHYLATEVNIYQLFKANMGKRKYKSIKAASKTASKKFADESLDVVFIDLTHTYEAVKEDIELWLPKVKKGGYIAGDDYHQNWQGVIQAVDELLPNRTLIDDCWLYCK
jgi:predicted O-methyltransferase YrrM